MRPRRPLALAAVAAGALCSCSGTPALCDSCPDVAGVYSLTRTLEGELQCPGAPLPGAVRLLVSQNGSRLTFEYEGAVLKGELYADLTTTAGGKRTEAGVELRLELSGTFAFDEGRPDGLLLRADVIQTTTQGNPGQSCEVRASLEGAR